MKGYKYVWCRNSQVYAREKEGGSVIKISSVCQVDTLLA
nr:unnamed protein product [Callosobruchus analis]CAI5847830.1 unnamed protein product [Callosobruchus analis]